MTRQHFLLFAVFPYLVTRITADLQLSNKKNMIRKDLL